MPGIAQATGAADPQHSLQIAQAARAFFQIGFEVVVRVEEARVAPLLFLLFGEVESAIIEMLPQCSMQCGI